MSMAIFHVSVNSSKDTEPLLTIEEVRKAVLAKCLEKKPGTQCEADLELAGVYVTASRR